jgi:hypothetical protein
MTDRKSPLIVGQTLIGPLFNEPMRVETVQSKSLRYRLGELLRDLSINAMTRPMELHDDPSPFRTQ